MVASNNKPMLNRQQAIIWTKDGLVYWQIYVLFGLNEYFMHSDTVSNGLITP